MRSFVGGDFFLPLMTNAGIERYDISSANQHSCQELGLFVQVTNDHVDEVSRILNVRGCFLGQWFEVEVHKMRYL